VNIVATLFIAVLMLFAVPVFAEDNLYEQRTSMENEVYALFAQKARTAESNVIEKAQTRITLNTKGDKEGMPVKPILNLLPYLSIK
jgi:hypothetical protein